MAWLRRWTSGETACITRRSIPHCCRFNMPAPAQSTSTETEALAQYSTRRMPQSRSAAMPTGTARSSAKRYNQTEAPACLSTTIARYSRTWRPWATGRWIRLRGASTNKSQLVVTRFHFQSMGPDANPALLFWHSCYHGRDEGGETSGHRCSGGVGGAIDGSAATGTHRAAVCGFLRGGTRTARPAGARRAVSRFAGIAAKRGADRGQRACHGDDHPGLPANSEIQAAADGEEGRGGIPAEVPGSAGSATEMGDGRGAGFSERFPDL